MELYQLKICFNRFPESEYTTPTITQEDMTVDRIYDKLNEHLQSNDQIAVEGRWSGYMVVSRLVVDRRRRRRRRRNNHENEQNDVILSGNGKKDDYLHKLGLLKVDVDQHCLGHAVLLGMSMSEKSDLYKAFLAGFDRYLKIVVEQNLQEVENSCEVLSKLDKVKKYSMRKLSENYLSNRNFDLAVYTKKEENVVKIYDSGMDYETRKLVLYHDGNHFDVVQNAGVFLYGRKVNFCVKCLIKVKDANNHVCYSRFHCFKCRQRHEKNLQLSGHVICSLCDCTFDDEFCLRSHYKKSLTVGINGFKGKCDISPCDLYKFCVKCFSVVRKFVYIDLKGTKQMHNCSTYYCKICEVERPLMHNCCLPNYVKRTPFYTMNFDEKYEIYVFDFETEANPSNLGIFKLYFAAVYKFCNVCMDDFHRKMEYQCCGLNDWICFEGDNMLTSFGNYLVEIASKNIKSRWFAHNGSKFDNLFLLHYLVCERNFIPKVIMQGMKIMKLIYKNAEVLDSMLFMPSSLKKTVQMLDLGTHVKKGYYPYDFTDLNYVGPIPNKKCFEISKFDKEELEKFEKWYDEKAKYDYVLRNEVREYCMNDVFILTKSLIKFHSIIFKHKS